MTERIITEIADKPWEVIQMRVKDLKPNPENPRIITEEDFNRLKRKIKRQGFRSTIMLDNDGVILGGNQRYNALMSLGYQDMKIPVMIPLFKMTEKERQEAIITDNISDGSWNNEMLANQYNINDLLEWGMDTDWIAQPPDPENPEQRRRPEIMKCYRNIRRI